MSKYQLPPLPAAAHRGPNGTGDYFDSFTAAQMHAYALAALAQQAQVKPFAYMADDVAAGVIGGQEVLLSAAIRGAPGGTFNFPLYTLAQQAQEPVAAALGDIVALWDKYAPSEYMTATHMQAKRALAGQQPVSPDMHRWCAYVGGMVASWVTSEPDAHARLGDDKFEVAIAGIIERRLWAMPKRDTTPPAPQPAPVDELKAWLPIEADTVPDRSKPLFWLLVDGSPVLGYFVEIPFREIRDADGRYIDQQDADAFWATQATGDQVEPTHYCELMPPTAPQTKGQP